MLIVKLFVINFPSKKGYRRCVIEGPNPLDWDGGKDNNLNWAPPNFGLKNKNKNIKLSASDFGLRDYAIRYVNPLGFLPKYVTKTNPIKEEPNELGPKKSLTQT